MSNKTSDKNVANIEDEIMSQEAFNELIDNFEVVATLTMYGRKSIKHYVKEMQAELERKDKRIKELEEEKAMLKRASNIAKEVNIEDVTDVINKSCKEFMSNYIPKQVIIDKIKEYDKKMEEDAGHPNWVITDRIVINVLQELLGGERNELER